MLHRLGKVKRTRFPTRTAQRECDRWMVDFMVDFNEVRPHDALGGKTPSEVHRDSPRRSLVPRVATYPPEWQTRRVNRMGIVRIDGDVVFVSTPLTGQIIGLRQETELLWSARFFDVELGTLEILPRTLPVPWRVMTDRRKYSRSGSPEAVGVPGSPHLTRARPRSSR